MRICVCTAQVPFMTGGAELHVENLAKALRAAGHDTDVVRLPVSWDRRHLLESSFAWRLLHIDADLVVATNFPSYLVRHPRKVVWLFHQHRAAYDCVDEAWSDFGTDEASLDDQQVLSEWDTRALEEAVRVFTTSGVVAERVARYNGIEATPLYHPPPLFDSLHPGSFGDYAFCATRLEGNKRPELIVESLAHARSGVRARIAGRGGMAEQLATLAEETGVSSRLDLLGFVPDSALVEEYAGAFAVVYAPFDEDYGYVTLQAFAAGKPVVTSTDAGGVLEWVEDGVTGIVTDGSPAAIGAALERLADDPALARRMGEAGRERVRALDWPPVIQALLQA